MTFLKEKIRNGISEVEDCPGHFRVIIEGEPVGEPVKGFSRSIAHFRRLIGTTGEFHDGVESSGIAILLNRPHRLTECYQPKGTGRRIPLAVPELRSGVVPFRKLLL